MAGREICCLLDIGPEVAWQVLQTGPDHIFLEAKAGFTPSPESWRTWDQWLGLGWWSSQEKDKDEWIWEQTEVLSRMICCLEGHRQGKEGNSYCQTLKATIIPNNSSCFSSQPGKTAENNFSPNAFFITSLTPLVSSIYCWLYCCHGLSQCLWNQPLVTNLLKRINAVSNFKWLHLICFRSASPEGTAIDLVWKACFCIEALQPSSKGD